MTVQLCGEFPRTIDLSYELDGEAKVTEIMAFYEVFPNYRVVNFELERQLVAHKYRVDITLQRLVEADTPRNGDDGQARIRAGVSGPTRTTLTAKTTVGRSDRNKPDADDLL